MTKLKGFLAANWLKMPLISQQVSELFYSTHFGDDD